MWYTRGTMKIQFHSKNTEINAKIKGQMESKLEVLKKYKGALDVLHVQVNIGRDQHHNKGDVYEVEVNVKLPQKVLNSVQSAGDILSALDSVIDKLERQARDLKEKIISQKKKG